jgi:peptide/nickel transport system substrate-binding protein
VTDASTDPSRDPFTLDRRQFLLAALGGAGALALAGCTGSGSGAKGSSGSSASGGGGSAGRPTLRLADGALGFPSPFASNGGPGYNQMILLYDTLLWTDDSGKPIPWLAKTMKVSADHLTYTFELRDNVKWSDGQPLTADDVVFTFDYYAKQGSLSPPVIIQPPHGIAKVSSSAPNTVEFVLDAPAVTFPAQVAGAVPIIPKHVWEPIKDPGIALDRKVLVGTGPYTLAEYNDDGGPMLYLAKDDYFLGAPYVKRIEMRQLDDAFAAMLANSVDFAAGLGMRDDALAPFKANSGEYGMINSVGDFVNSQLYWNVGKGGALGDAKFRQAMAMAIDRKDLLTRLSGGRGAVGNPGFLGPKNPYFTAVRQYDFDVAGANALLDSAGYKMGSNGIRQGLDGKPLSFDFRFDSGGVGPPMSEIVIPGIKKIGIELRPSPALVGPELFGPKLFGGYDMAVLLYPGPAPGGPNADPDVLREVFRSKPPDTFSLTAASKYSNPEFDVLADKQLVTFDEAQRHSLVDQMQKILADDIPILPLFYPQWDFVFRKKVLDNWYFTPGEFPTADENKAIFVTGNKTGSEIRAAK